MMTDNEENLSTMDTLPPVEEEAPMEPISTPSEPESSDPALPKARYLQPSEVGDYIIQLCKLNIPCDYGDEKFSVICKDYSKGFGTCCGFLPHWALFEAGCRMKLVNRNEKEAGLSYAIGRNIGRIWNNGNPPFKRFVRGTTPPRGGIVYVSNGPPNTEHVFIFEEAVMKDGKVWWRGYHGGQSNEKGEQCIRAKEVVLEGRTLGGRGIIGWLDPASLIYEAPALELCNPDTGVCYEPVELLHAND